MAAFLLFCGLWCGAIGQTIHFNHLTLENGLASNAVIAITQDHLGFMWYGTINGLNRYDGNRFETFKTDASDSASISNNGILSLFVDSKRNLWIGTHYGLNRYDYAARKFKRVFPGKFQHAQDNKINCITEDKKGNLWVGTGKGLHVIDKEKLMVLQSFFSSGSGNSLAGNDVQTFHEDKAGYLWVGTNGGLTKMQQDNGGYRYQSFHHLPSDITTISGNFVTCIEEDSQNNLWFGTKNNGVNLLNPDGKTFTRLVQNNGTNSLVNNNVRKIVPDKNGQLWIGTQEGLSIVDPSTKTVRSWQHEPEDKASLSQNSIYDIYGDQNGTIWIGTYHGGVNFIDPYKTPFATLQSHHSQWSLSNNVVSGIAEDDKHNLWIGTEGGGLNYYDRETEKITVFRNNLSDEGSIGSNLVKAVYVDRDGNVWAGTQRGGLNVLPKGDARFKKLFYSYNSIETLNSEIVSILEDSKGRFWVGSNAGLKQFKRDGTSLSPILHIATLAGLAKTLKEDSKGNLWVGTTNRLYVMEGNQPRAVLQGYSVNAIHEDAAGNIWVGLNDKGLGVYNTSVNKLTLYNDKERFPLASVLGILEDDWHHLWLSTNSGLVKFDPEKKSFQRYTTVDGIAGNTFNNNSFYKDSKNQFFFGGFNGLTHFYPGEIEINNHKSPVVITGVKLFNNAVEINSEDGLLTQDIRLTKAITLTHDQDVFSVEFALLNFVKSEKNKYAYKLEGYDKDWNIVSTGVANFTRLPSGNYTLLVRGINNDGISSDTVSLKIKLLPPLWRTWWAYCLYALCVAGVIFLLARFFILKTLLKKEDELHQVKINFFTNVSHEILTHLTMVMVPIEKMLHTKKQDEYTYQQLSVVKRNATRLLKLVSELIDFRKAETAHLALHVTRNNIIPYLEEIRESFHEMSLSKNILTSFVYNKAIVPVYFDKEQMEKVFFNILTNAFKFAPDGGRISISVQEKDNAVEVKISDNGRGIAPEFMDKLFQNFFQVPDHGVQNTGYGIGLALSKNIVELHKGTIAVESEMAAPGQQGFTSFTVRLQQGNKHFANVDEYPITLEPDVTEITETEQMPVTQAAQLSETATDTRFTILLAEDNEEVRSLLVDTFKSNYKLLTCADGMEGWQAAVTEIPDLVISDVMMPQMDGFTFCAKLKTDSRTSHIPVILLTAKTSQADQVSGLETGADSYITKPFSSRLLELNARNLLASREKLRQKFSRQMLAAPDVVIEEPQESLATTIRNKVEQEFLEKVVALVEEHMGDPEFGVDMLARKVAMSQPVLYKKLKAVTDMSVNDFIKSLRLKRAAEMIKSNQFAVYEVGYAIGYNDRKYFSREFKKQFGKTPSEYGGKKESLQ